jgi:hypothetical protein
MSWASVIADILTTETNAKHANPLHLHQFKDESTASAMKPNLRKKATTHAGELLRPITACPSGDHRRLGVADGFGNGRTSGKD